jgi:pumilio family protein 6
MASAAKASSSKRSAPSDASPSSKKAKFDPKVKSTGFSKKPDEKKKTTYEKPQKLDLVTDSLKIWNDLRKKNNTNEVNRSLADSLFALLEGKALTLAKKHDASRVVQAMIQFGTPEQRVAILNELKENIVDLSKQQYSHFIVLKLFKYCSAAPASRRVLLNSLKGNLVSLSTHAVAARVVEYALGELPSRDAGMLKREFCGKQYTLFDDAKMSATPAAPSPLPQSVVDKVIAENPTHQESIVAHVLTIVEKMIEKKLFPFEFFHELLASYCSVAGGEAVRALAGSVVDSSLHLLSTRAGTRALSMMSSYSSAKDRKRIIKCLKGYTRSTLMHRDAYVAVIRIIQVTDDTVSTQKMVLNELLKPENETATDHPLFSLASEANASKLLLLLLDKSSAPLSSHFDPWELALLGEATIKDVETGEMVSTSKKNPDTRKAELRQYLRSDILKMIAAHAPALLRSAVGAKVMVSACSQWSDELGESVTSAIEEEGGMDLFEDRVAQKCIEKMIKLEGSTMAQAIVSKFEGKLGEIAGSNRGAFVISALLDVAGGDVKAATKKNLKKIADKNVKDQNVKQKNGYEALLKNL